MAVGGDRRGGGASTDRYFNRVNSAIDYSNREFIIVLSGSPVTSW